MTVSDYAKDVNLSVAEILKKCHELGISVKSANDELTDDDIREMVEDQKAQKEYSIFGEQVWEEPEDDRSYGGYSGGGGGVPDFSGGGYSDDFGEDMDMTESDVEMASPLGAIDSASLRNVDLGNETTPETE